MRNMYHQNRFFFGAPLKNNHKDYQRPISALEEAEARALTGDPQEQLEIIAERRARRSKYDL